MDDVLARIEAEPFDHVNLAGAEALKQRIEAYWAERGFEVTITLHNVGFHPAIRAVRFDLRSDMVNGYPQARVQAKAA